MESITEHEKIKQQILKVLNWNDEEYFWYQIECGIKYLQLYLPNDVEGQELLKKQSMFWNWWKNHWYAREQAFVHTTEIMCLSLCVELYYSLHDANELVKEIKPGRVILGKMFATQI